MTSAAHATRPITERPPRPSVLPVQPESIAPALRDRPGWVVWRWGWSTKRASWGKWPFRPARPTEFAKSNDPTTMSDYTTALAVYQRSQKWVEPFDGVEILIQPPLVGVDLDKCLGEGGTVLPWAVPLVEALAGTYGERSPSGHGLKLFLFADIERSAVTKGIEVYRGGRFFTVTGHRWDASIDVADDPSVRAGLDAVLRSVDEAKQAKRRAAYAARAIRDEVLVMRATTEPGRHNQLRSSAQQLYGLVGQGLCDQVDVDDELRAAALDTGLDDHEITDVLTWAWEHPSERQAPDFGRTNGHIGAATDAPPPEPEAVAYPRCADAIAFHGLAGQIITKVLPHTEADQHGLLMQLLIGFGAIVGDSPHQIIGATRHPAREYAALIGSTAGGRKGDSWAVVRRVLTQAVPIFMAQRQQSGLTTGEGALWLLRDDDDDPNKDKRLLIVEPEFGRLLRVSRREGSTISAVLRELWETGSAQSITKQHPFRVSGAHVAIVGHVTKEELNRELMDLEILNGFGNRFLWCCVRRQKLLPNPVPLTDQQLAPLAGRLGEAIVFAQSVRLMQRDQAANDRYIDAYMEELNREEPGLQGAVVARAAPHVVRLSALYALLDQSATIGLIHIEAALALWRYCADSARYVFGGSTGDTIGDSILRALRGGPLTRTQINRLFGSHVPSERITVVLVELEAAGKIAAERIETAGRPVVRWSLMEPA